MDKLYVSVFLAVGIALLLQLAPAEGGRWPDSCGNNKTHNFFFGTKAYYDRLLYTNHTAVGRSFLRKLSFDVSIPSPGASIHNRISYIEVLDQYQDGRGGCVYLASGGPGYPNAILHFKSQRNHGVNFIVNVWGH